jgi:hypothetical protein
MSLCSLRFLLFKKNLVKLARFQGIALQRRKGAKVARGNGSLTNDHRLLAWTGVGKILFVPRRLCSAISRIHSFLTKLFHHEEHEGHEVLIITDCMIFLRDLRVLRGENWVAARRAVSLRLCVEILLPY